MIYKKNNNSLILEFLFCKSVLQKIILNFKIKKT